MKPQLLELPIADLQQDRGTGLGNVREVHVDDALRGLAASIKQIGVKQPVLVAQSPRGQGYVLVSGHRRVAAAKLAGLKTVPAVVAIAPGFSFADYRGTQLAENLHRENLTPLEEARAYAELGRPRDGFARERPSPALTQAQIAQLVGKSQPYVANRIRLLELPQEAAAMLESGQITPTVAEQLLRLPKDAKGARNMVVRRIRESIDYRGGIGEKDVRHVVEQALRSEAERRARARVMESLKFPACPVKGCGAGGRLREFTWNRQSRELSCSSGHSWSGVSGKVTRQEGYGRAERSPEPPKPTLPLVRADVPTPGLAPVAARVLGGLEKVEWIGVDQVSGSHVRVIITATAPELVKSGIKPFDLSREGPAMLHGVDRYGQRTDAQRRAVGQARAAFEGFIATVRGRGRPKKGEGA